MSGAAGVGRTLQSERCRCRRAEDGSLPVCRPACVVRADRLAPRNRLPTRRRTARWRHGNSASAGSASPAVPGHDEFRRAGARASGGLDDFHRPRGAAHLQGGAGPRAVLFRLRRRLTGWCATVVGQLLARAGAARPGMCCRPRSRGRWAAPQPGRPVAQACPRGRRCVPAAPRPRLCRPADHPSPPARPARPAAAAGSRS